MVRGCAIAVGVVLLAYVLLPWWLPMERIRDRIVETLSQELGREVSIGHLRVAWGDGVEIGQITIRRREGFGEGDLLRVRRVNLPFAPIRMAFGRLGHLSVDGVEAYLVGRDDGRINFEDLLDPRKQSDELGFTEVRLGDARCHLLSETDEGLAESVLEIEEAQFKTGPADGIEWTVRARQDGAEAATIIGQGRIGSTGNDTNGEQYGRLTVRRLDMGRLQLKRWIGLIDCKYNLFQGDCESRLTLQQLDGECSLDAELKVAEDQALQVAGRLELDRLTVTHASQNLIMAGGLRCEFEVGFDPATHVVQVKRAPVAVLVDGADQSPALAMMLTGKYDPRPGADDTLALWVTEGGCKPDMLLALSPVLAQHDAIARQAMTSEGTISFGGEFHSNEWGDRSKVRVDGSNWRLHSRTIDKQLGEPAGLELRSEFERATGRLRVDPIRLEFLSLRGGGKVTIPNRYAIDAMNRPDDYAKHLLELLEVLIAQRRSLGVDLQVEIGDFAEMARVAPGLSETVKGLQLSGPVETELHIGAAAERETGEESLSSARMRHAAARIRLGEQTQCIWQEGAGESGITVLKKMEGSSLTIELAGDVDPGAPRLENLVAKASLGQDGEFALGPALVTWPDAQADEDGLKVAGPWEIAGIEHWLKVLPALGQALEPEGIAIEGRCGGTVKLEHEAARGWSATVNAEMDELGIAAGSVSLETPVAKKPPGHPMRLALTAQEWWNQDQLESALTSSLELSVGQGWLRVQAEAGRRLGGMSVDDISLRKLSIDARSDELERLRDRLPGLFERDGSIAVGPYRVDRLSGRVAVKAAIHIAPLGASVQLDVTADDTAFSLSKIEPNRTAAGLGDVLSPGASFTWEKNAGDSLGLGAEANLSRENDTLNKVLWAMMGASEPLAVEMAELSVRAGDSRMTLRGELVVNKDVRLKGWGHWLEVLQEAQLEWDGQIDCDEAAAVASNGLLAGEARMTGQLNWQANEDRLQCRMDVDMSDMAIAGSVGPRLSPDASGMQVTLDKPAGDELSVSVEVGGGMKLPDVQLEELEIACLGGYLRCAGILEDAALGDFIEGRAERPGRAAELTVDFQMPDLANLQGWMPQLRHCDLQGRAQVSGRVSAQFEPSVVAYLHDSLVDMKAEALMGRTPLGLEVNAAQLSSSRALLPAVNLRLGESAVTLAADVRNPISLGEESNEHEVQASGRIDVLSRNIDIDEIQRIGLALAEQFDLSRGREMSTIQADANDIVALLSRNQLGGSARIEHLGFTDASFQARLELDELQATYGLDDKGLAAEFSAGLNGGVVNGRITCDYTAWPPTVVQEIDMREASVDDLLVVMVENQFPGMEVNGTISEKKELAMPLADLLAGGVNWVGEGMTTCRDGVLYGPGGPAWMIKAFPGLRLVEYKWEQMTNQYKSLPNGRKKNHMLFRGNVYDIYIDGVSIPVSDANDYAGAIAALEADLQQSLEHIAEIEAGESKMAANKQKQLRRRSEGLAGLWDRHQAGEELRVTTANYVVGGLVSVGGKGLFEKPREILRAPLFRSESFIIERFMVGIETRNVTLAEIGRESWIYRAIYE